MVVLFLTVVRQVLRPSVQEWVLPACNPVAAAPCTRHVLSPVRRAVQDSVPEWVPVRGSVSARVLVAQEWVHLVSRRLQAKRRGRSVRDPAAAAVHAMRRPKKAQ